MTEATISPLKRRQVIDALRFGAVPVRGLEHIATGLDRFEAAIDGDLDMVALGAGRLKALRGEYGTGKTFFARWLEHRAQQRGFATSLVQISPTEAPLHRFELVYRAAMASMATKEFAEGAFRSVLDAWFFRLENEATERGLARADDAAGLARAVGNLLDQRLRGVSLVQPLFANALRATYEHRMQRDGATEEGLIAWVMGQPNVGVAIKNAADVRGEIDATVASSFLRGVLEVLRQSGRPGLVLVLDEVETIQRIRLDQRERALGELRRLVDDLFAERFPGLYLVLTGTTSFFEGPQGIKRAPALAQRLETLFHADPARDSTRAPQIRLLPFDFDRLVEVGRKVRALYPARDPARIAKVDDPMLRALAENVRGALGGKLGVAPRVYLRRLVQLLDTIDEHPDYDPAKEDGLVVGADEAARELEASRDSAASGETGASTAANAGEVPLDLDGAWDPRGDEGQLGDE